MSATMSSKKRCTGSGIPLSASVPSSSDPYHHYGAICPECGRAFLLPHYNIPIHYVNAQPDTAYCRCGHTRDRHSADGYGYCRARIGVTCLCNTFQETRSNMTTATK